MNLPLPEISVVAAVCTRPETTKAVTSDSDCISHGCLILKIDLDIELIAYTGSHQMVKMFVPNTCKGLIAEI